MGLSPLADCATNERLARLSEVPAAGRHALVWVGAELVPACPQERARPNRRHMDERPEESTWVTPVTDVEPSARAAIYGDFGEFVVLSGRQRLDELVGQRMPARVTPSGIGRVASPRGAGVEFCE